MSKQKLEHCSDFTSKYDLTFRNQQKVLRLMRTFCGSENPILLIFKLSKKSVIIRVIHI